MVAVKVAEGFDEEDASSLIGRKESKGGSDQSTPVSTPHAKAIQGCDQRSRPLADLPAIDREQTLACKTYRISAKANSDERF